MVLLALACEGFGEGPLGQPANTVTSLAFVIAGLLVLGGRRGAGGVQWPYVLLVIAVGAGSLIQHGPHPPWQAYAHDLPLASLLAFVAADAAEDLTGALSGAGSERRGRGEGDGPGRGRWRRWWPVVAVAMVPVVAAGPVISTVVQGLLAVVAVGLNLVRARERPRLRRTLLWSLSILAAGALAGTLTDRTPLCQPDSLWQGHAAWHVLAAAALWCLAPAIGSRGEEAPPEPIPAGPTAVDAAEPG